MKILMLSESLALGGGAEKFTATLGSELAKKGYEIIYLTYFDSESKNEFKGEYLSFDDEIHGNFISKLLNFFFKPFKIKKICDEKQIDVVISVGEDPNIRAIISKFYGNKSKIISSHHLDPGIHLKHKVRGNEIKFLYPKADKVVCVSKDIQKSLENDYSVDNAVTIYNMLDIDYCIKKSHEELQEEYKSIFKSSFVFINVGRLSYQKGQWFLLKSFKKVLSDYKDAKLCILGDGELKQDLLELVNDLKLEKNVFFLGNQKNIFPFLKNSSCFVLSSILEGFPLTLIEALSTNIPVISTDCKTGPKECLCPELDLEESIEYPYFGEYGVLTEPLASKIDFKNSKEKLDASEEMLYQLMIKIIEDSKLRKKYSNGLNRAKDFDVSKIVDEWEKLF